MVYMALGDKVSQTLLTIKWVNETCQGISGPDAVKLGQHAILSSWNEIDIIRELVSRQKCL